MTALPPPVRAERARLLAESARFAARAVRLARLAEERAEADALRICAGSEDDSCGPNVLGGYTEEQWIEHDRCETAYLRHRETAERHVRRANELRQQAAEVVREHRERLAAEAPMQRGLYGAGSPLVGEGEAA